MAANPTPLTFPATSGRWLKARGLGNTETLRQMLIYLEQEGGLNLKPKGAQGRLINANVDELLVRCFQQAEKQNGSPLAVLQEVTATYVTPAEWRRFDPQLNQSISGEVDQQELLEQIEQQVATALLHFLEEQQQLAQQERDDQRRLWNKKWEHSLRKAESSFTQKMQETQREYETALQHLREKREADEASLERLSESLAGVASQVSGLEYLLTRREWEASEAAELNDRMERLVGTAEKAIVQQAAKDKLLTQSLKRTLAQAERSRLMLSVQTTWGVVLGVALTSLLHLGFPQKFQTIGNALLLMSAVFVGVVIYWWKRE